ncbi:MAG: phage integrase SAM-like domain-containing protein [Bacteroidia bacterium]|nr:phage integrase SAM-like domain-containing protein [Bacteroidia bacterium]
MKLYFEYKKDPKKGAVKKDGTKKEILSKEGMIRVILIQQGKKVITSTGHKINESDWSKGRPKPIAKNANLNLYLNKYVSAFDDYMIAVKLANDIPSLTRASDFIKTKVNSINVERGNKDIPSLIIQFKNEKTGFLREGALKPFTTLSNHLMDYNSNIQFADFDEIFANKFAKFLSEKSKHYENATDLQNPTINKMLVTLKVFCKWAYKNKHTSATEWMNIKRVKEIDQRIITLTSEELNTYYNFDFGVKVNLEKAKDVFCFASFLGLRYNDLMQVNDQTIKKGYIHINTQKNDKELRIKLIPQALQILKKYDNCLPLDISNQKLNKNIKSGVKLAGIDRRETIIVQHLNVSIKKQRFVHELISIHDARKTFITLCLENGLSVSEVMQMSTHNSYRSFSRYVNLEQSKVDEKLQDVFGYLKVVR